MLKHNHTILALDPGLRDLGFAVLAGRRLVARDVIALRSLPKERRLDEARDRIAALVLTHHPRSLVVEKIFDTPGQHSRVEAP